MVAGTAWPIDLPTLQVREVALDVAVLRLWRPTDASIATLSRAFALPWPTTPNTVAGGTPRVLWLAPAEWGIVGQPSGAVRARVAQACPDALWHLADLTEGRVGFVIGRERARDLLAKGCSLDLHPRAFGGDACAQTLLEQVNVWIERQGGASAHDAFLVHADRSVAAWLRDWFTDAALEDT